MTVKKVKIAVRTETGRICVNYRLKCIPEASPAHPPRYVLDVSLCGEEGKTAKEREEVLLPAHFTEEMAKDALRLVCEGIVTPCTLRNVAEDL